MPPLHNKNSALVPPRDSADRAISVLKISAAATNRCSFCHHPETARRPGVSRRPNDVLGEDEKLVAPASRKCLSSRRNRAYGVDLKMTSSPWKDRESAPDSSIWQKSSASSAPGSAANTSIPIRMSTRSWHDDRGQIMPYLRLPFQHASEPVLRAMKRPGGTGKKNPARIKKWRNEALN